MSSSYTLHSLRGPQMTLKVSPVKTFPVKISYLLVLRKPTAQLIHKKQSNNSISIIWNNFVFEIYSVAGFIITGSHQIRQLQLRISY
uniref:Ovule protein n=1 Tax=Strongyloides venezuelensis TaxID=75913 RepID=A0A0K0G1S6_STRVS